MILKRDEAFMAVCEFRTQLSDSRFLIGTGMFVSSPVGEGKVRGWIVTASHVALDTSEKTEVIISTHEGLAEGLPLTMLGDLSTWRHHPIADMSVFQITLSDKNNQFMEGRFFPYDHINTEIRAVSRDDELTAIGFPKGLGTEKYFSPFTFRSYASSGFVTLCRGDNGQKSTFFCLENPGVGGYSGCPVFDLGYVRNGSMILSKEKTWCHGIMHGTMSDETGGKIALVTPTFYLKDLIFSL